MDIRVLQYFLAVAREESITGAAEALHITQPPLSRQLKELETELGKQLFVRGKRGITLTDEGRLLRKRAEEIVELMEKTKADITSTNAAVAGDVYVGGAETNGIRAMSKAVAALHSRHPHICFHMYSGHAEDVTDRLDRGLLDFGVFIEPADLTKYEYFKLPTTDVWGVLMRKNSPLSTHETVSPKDLAGQPLIMSNQAMVKNEMAGWMGVGYDRLRIVATYNLLFNASILVEEGVGYALALDGIIKTGADDPLCFRPLEPRLEVGLMLAWKKYQVFTKAAELFLETLQKTIAGREARGTPGDFIPQTP